MSSKPYHETIAFTNTQGEHLAGVLHRPAETPKASILYAACFSCDKDIPVAVRLGNALAKAGFAMLRFDLPGLGESEGDFANFSFNTLVDDLTQAAAWMGDIHLAPQILIGHSIGGAAVLATAPMLESVGAVVTLAAPSNLEHLAQLLHNNATRKDDRYVSLPIGGREYHFTTQFLEELKQQPPFTESARVLGKPLLVMHAPDDDIVPYQHGIRLFEAAKNPRSFICLEGADHLLRRQADVNYTANLIANWVSPYIRLS